MTDLTPSDLARLARIAQAEGAPLPVPGTVTVNDLALTLVVEGRADAANALADALLAHHLNASTDPDLINDRTTEKAGDGRTRLTMKLAGGGLWRHGEDVPPSVVRKL